MISPRELSNIFFDLASEAFNSNTWRPASSMTSWAVVVLPIPIKVKSGAHETNFSVRKKWRCAHYDDTYQVDQTATLP